MAKLPEKKDKKMDDDITKCFTYNVDMVIQVFAQNEIDARAKLDKEGGYVSKRDVKLIDSIALFSGEK